MKPENKSLRVGAIAVAGALLLRLVSGDLPGKLIHFFSRPDTMTVMMFLETGTVVRTPQPQVTEPATEPTTPALSATELPVFSAADAQLVQIHNASGKKPDVAALLQEPLAWDLTTAEPTVLILHTHASESYADCSDNYRSLEEENNMLAVGQYIQEALEQAGICVIHDCTIHDYPSYNGSYTHARKSIQAYLDEYPSICLVLDIHRDAMEDSSGNQIATTATVDGQACAKLMMVVGTNAGGLQHPNWEENMALAVKLHVQLEKLYPGITRPISLRSQRFNQDLSTGAMLIEVGAAGNTQQQALNAAKYLSDAIISLSQGTKQ